MNLKLKKGLKTYKTETNLVKAIEKLGFENIPNMIVIHPIDKRFTAVFFGSEALDAGTHFEGFYTVHGFDYRNKA